VFDVLGKIENSSNFKSVKEKKPSELALPNSNIQINALNPITEESKEEKHPLLAPTLTVDLPTPSLRPKPETSVSFVPQDNNPSISIERSPQPNFYATESDALSPSSRLKKGMSQQTFQVKPTIAELNTPQKKEHLNNTANFNQGS
jgi:hypothetical protein